MDNLTYIPPLPDSLVKWGRCLLLHKQYAVMGDDLKIRYFCKECQNDNDTTEDKEASQSP